MSAMTREEAMEELAALLCVLEFRVHWPKEGVHSYWQCVREASKNQYRSDAKHFINALHGRKWRLNPLEPTLAMCEAARGAATGIRSLNGAARTWTAMVEASPNFRLVAAS